jgi:glycosyltransferase involved in cell wall biosynthesis
MQVEKALSWRTADAATPAGSIKADDASSEDSLRKGHTPRSILFVAWRDLANPLAGGSEQVIHELAQGLSERGVEVSLLCGGPVASSFLYKTVQSGGTYSQFVRVPFSYRRQFRSTDLVVEVCNGMPFLAPLWRRGPSLCFVHHVHTELWRGRFNPAVAALGRAVESKVMPFVHRRNLIVTVSPSSRASLRGLGVEDERIREIPMGVNEPPAPLTESKEPLFVAAGRLVGYKRIGLLLRLWQSVYPMVGGRLVIVGDGPDRHALQSMNVEGVDFVGFVSEEEKHRLMSEAWMLVHPAQWEGWGIVITEAAARGTTSIGFDVPGVRDSIRADVTGVIATSEDDFIKQWIALAQDPIRRKEFADNARRQALNRSWPVTVDRFMSIATEAIARERDPQSVVYGPGMEFSSVEATSG